MRNGWNHSARIVVEEEDYDFDHDEIVEKLVEIGNGLGFEASSEQQIARGARVDVLWQARIANLGVVSYVFEVQRGGSTTPSYSTCRGRRTILLFRSSW
ncbi:MAG: hypothetical protein QW385_07555 [Thermoproteota archaeon]